ncbi:MAG: hypothetical protein JSS57_16600 [Proteobacteria bacterium]|nr:hypothetical protein [Pseudomonadota bacterium]
MSHVPLKHPPHHERAEAGPCDDQANEGFLPNSVPFATLHVRLFKELPTGMSRDDRECYDACREEAESVFEGFEKVLKVNRHKSFEFLEFVMWCFSQTGLFFFALVLGTLLGIDLHKFFGGVHP